MLETRDLSYNHPNEKPLIFPNFTLVNGQALLIIGKSGVGKTTLLHLLATILKPKTGTLLINNENTSALSPADLSKFRAKNIGLVFQKPHFVIALTAKENIILASFLAGNNVNEAYLNQLTKALNIDEILHKNINQLSLGEQQRVSIARALINKPALILADEPTSSLDDDSCANVIELLKSQAKSIEANLIIVTHDFRLKNAFKNQITLEK